jgi:hypothetical protein
MPHLTMDQINIIVQKVDTKSDTHIYWDDFLKFLEHEGEMREMINDMRINHSGTTRLKEGPKFKIIRSANVQTAILEPNAMPSFSTQERNQNAEDKVNTYHVEKMIFLNMVD